MRSTTYYMRFFFSLVFIYELIFGILSRAYSAEYLLAHGYSMFEIGLIFSIRSIMFNIILLGILFICYRMGSQFNLKIHFRQVLLVLLGGAYLGSSLGLLFASLTISPPESFETVFYGFFSASHISNAFVIFTAISLGYIRIIQNSITITHDTSHGTSSDNGKIDPYRPHLLWFILVIFCVSLITGTLHAWRMYLIHSLIEQNLSYTVIEHFLLVASFLVDWINLAMLLLVSFWVGRYLNLKRHLGAVIFFIIICIWLGYSLGDTIIIFRVLAVSLSSAFRLGFLSSFGMVFMPFFQIFTALSIAYLISPHVQEAIIKCRKNNE